jgi:predicted DNA-binding transcriptional regulator AlpA
MHNTTQPRKAEDWAAAQAAAGTTTEKTKDRLLRLPSVLEIVEMSRSGWLLGVKEGRYPAPIKLSPRVAVWLESDIFAFVAGIARKKKEQEVQNETTP